MGGGLSARRARVLAARHVAVSATGARRRRVCKGRSRPPLSLWWLSSPGLDSLFSRESDAVVFSLRLCKKGRVCIRTHRHGGYYDDYVIAPGSGRGPGGHSSPLRGVSVKAALSVVFQGSSIVPRSARARRPSRSTSRTVVSLDGGSRVLVQEVASGNKVLLWLQRAQLIETLLPCRCVPPRLSRNRNQAALAPLGPASLRSPHVIIWFGLTRRTPRK